MFARSTLHAARMATRALTRTATRATGHSTARHAPAVLARARSSTAAAHMLNSVIDEALQEARDAGTYKEERVIVTPQAAHIGVQPPRNSHDAAPTESTSVLNFCANNYLGLSDNPQLIDAAKSTLDSHGLGLSSVRFICGTQDIHKTLEGKIADFHSQDDAILYAACFDANAGIFEAILGPEDAVLSDELNHASIIDGVRLCKARKARFKHMDMHDLEEQLKATQDARMRLIVTDGVFSMDGDIAPLDEICALADKYSALVMIDECHATGFVGKTGRGTPEYFGVTDQIDIVNSTLGKALGGASGGYTAASQRVVDLLRQRSRPYLFSNTLAPALVGASIATLDLIAEDTSFRDALMGHVDYFRSTLTEAGFTIAGADHPICPVMLGDAKIAGAMAEAMLDQGIYVTAFSFPVVPRGLARIRVQLSAAHSHEDVKKCADAFIAVGKDMGVIS